MRKNWSSSIRKAIYKASELLGSFEVSALEKDAGNLRRAQLRKLMEILKRNASTAYGKERAFANITSLEDFRRAIPVSDYESFRPYIDRMLSGEKAVLTSEEPFMFATTSGTTSGQKYIPVTNSYIKEFRHASTASGYYTIGNFPGIAEGVVFSIFSPATEGNTVCGIPYGAISGALYLRESILTKKFISPIPYPVYQIRDYESKYYTLLRLALALPVTCFYTLNPSTIVVLMKRLQKHADSLIQDVAEGTISAPSELNQECRAAIAPFLRADSVRAEELRKLLASDQFVPHKIWPRLAVVCCWTKAAAAFYLSDFAKYFGRTPVCDITYGASEGRGTVSLGDGRQMLSVRSHFFEFIPEEEIENPEAQVLLADEIVEGKNYYILFSTSAGLYRYHINDVIKVTGFYKGVPLIEFQYKGGNVSSFTGEKLTELQVTEAMSSLSAGLGLSLRFFTVLPEFRPNPHYRLLVEFDANGNSSPFELDLTQLSMHFDNKLAEINSEYRTKRESKRLDPVVMQILRSGTYEKLRTELVRSGVPDAQIKVSHLNPKAEIRKFFEQEIVELNGMVRK